MTCQYADKQQRGSAKHDSVWTRPHEARQSRQWRQGPQYLKTLSAVCFIGRCCRVLIITKLNIKKIYDLLLALLAIVNNF